MKEESSPKLKESTFFKKMILLLKVDQSKIIEEDPKDQNQVFDWE